jgi:peptide/nickel transport system substrate-binding protein
MSCKKKEEKMMKKFLVILSLILSFMLIFTACTPTDPDGPGSTTDRKGGWLDQITMKVVSGDAAITQIQAGDINIFADSLGRKEDLQAIEAAGLERSTQYGLFYELTFNPVGPLFDNGVINPFSNMKIREAMNWLIDREFINQEIYGGACSPKFMNVAPVLADYARYVETAREIEAKYAYNKQKAEEVITAELEAMGATKVDGKFMYNEEQVNLIFLIRNDGDGTRISMGDYISDQLESIGFSVDRQYKTGAEASPLWVGGNPADGLWHLYTGGWSLTGLSRDSADDFQFFYSSASAYGFTGLWQAYELDDDTYDLFDRLATNQYSTVAERGVLYKQALEKAAEYSYRVWLIDTASYSFWKPDVTTSYDLAAGVDVSTLTPFTIRYKDQEGGNLTWGSTGLFIDPPNPIAGSNWTFDSQWKNFTQDYAALVNPFSGLPMKQRLDKAEVVIQTGLPVAKTYDWVDLSFEDEIAVPGDAWADWDVDEQKFIPASEVYPEGTTAKRKSTVYYPKDLFDKVKYHDGSSLSVADFVMTLIMTFDPAMEGSDIYDESMAANLEAFKSTFKGARVVSESPLTIEFYSDTFYMDAELNVATFWPAYNYGQAGWHMIATGNLADAAGELAYSANKSEANEVEWMSYIAGPSLPILSKYTDQAKADKYVPYPNVLGAYITEAQAEERFTNLAAFYAARGHFYVGLGPYILDKVMSVEKTLTLVTNPDFIDYSDKWSSLAEPKFASVEVVGENTITAGEAASFDISVTFKGEAYPADEISSVKYLLFDATGNLVEVGQATFVAEGEYKVELAAASTEILGTGACKIEVAVVAIPISAPGFDSFEFVTE